MLNIKENWSLKILGGIFAVLNLALILGGLVSCGVEEQQRSTPTEQQSDRSDRDEDEQDDSKDDKDDDNEDKDDED